jgi:hypothetical protein
MADLWSGITDGITFYFSYVVTGPLGEEGVCSHHSNWTKPFHELDDLGEYSYSIHAIAKLDNIEAHHANLTGRFQVLGEGGREGGREGGKKPTINWSVGKGGNAEVEKHYTMTRCSARG